MNRAATTATDRASLHRERRAAGTFPDALRRSRE